MTSDAETATRHMPLVTCFRFSLFGYGCAALRIGREIKTVRCM